MSDVEVIIDGKTYDGWKSIKIKSSMESISKSFSIETSDKYGSSLENNPIKLGDEIKINIGIDRVLTGYIEQARNSISDGSHALSFSGRDKLGDIIDSSIANDFKSSNKTDLKNLANKLLTPFDIDVEYTAGATAKFKFIPETGENIFEALLKEAKDFGYLLGSTPEGNLKIYSNDTPVQASVDLFYGDNILSFDYNENSTDIFSSYTIKSQIKTSRKGLGRSRQVTEANDTMERYRYLMINAERKQTTESLKKRAKWEKQSRNDLSKVLTVKCQGLYQDNKAKRKKIWEIGQTVMTIIPPIKILDTYLISEVSYDVSNSGSFSTLKLLPKTAFGAV